MIDYKSHMVITSSDFSDRCHEFLLDRLSSNFMAFSPTFYPIVVGYRNLRKNMSYSMAMMAFHIYVQSLGHLVSIMILVITIVAFIIAVTLIITLLVLLLFVLSLLSFLYQYYYQKTYMNNYLTVICVYVCFVHTQYVCII